MRAGGAVARGVPGVPVEPVSCEVIKYLVATLAEVPPVWWPQAGGPSVHPRSGGRDKGSGMCGGAGPPRRPVGHDRPADAVTGLSVDIRVRRLVVHQADGFAEHGMSISVSYNPTPTTPLGFTARVSPAWGGDAMNGAEALWGRESMGGMGHESVMGSGGNRLDTEVGYGLPIGSRFVGTPRAGARTSEYGRDYRIGYGNQASARHRR